jgi:hypothetical protein
MRLVLFVLLALPLADSLPQTLISTWMGDVRELYSKVKALLGEDHRSPTTKNRRRPQRAVQRGKPAAGRRSGSPSTWRLNSPSYVKYYFHDVAESPAMPSIIAAANSDPYARSPSGAPFISTTMGTFNPCHGSGLLGCHTIGCSSE